jgi:hypothetical protein
VIVSPVMPIARAVPPLGETTGEPGPKPSPNAPDFARLSKTSPDTKPALICSNQTQRDAVRRNRVAWHAEGQGFESALLHNFRVSVRLLTAYFAKIIDLSSMWLLSLGNEPNDVRLGLPRDMTTAGN